MLAVLLASFVTLTGCGESPEEAKKVASAAELHATFKARVDSGNLAAAEVVGNTLTKRYPDSPEARNVAAQLPGIKEEVGRQRAAASSAKKAAQRAEHFEKAEILAAALKELNPSAVRKTGWDGAQIVLESFNASARVLGQNAQLAPLSDSERAQMQEFKRLLVRRQVEVLPLLRQIGAKEIDAKLWESDIDVAAKGARHATVSFVGAAFAANKNIAEAQRAFLPIMTRLRFQKAQYRWYEGADEFTYYELEPPSDETIAEVSSEGAVITTDTSYLGAG